jgi:NADH-quinone oxidoreductase subunit G
MCTRCVRFTREVSGTSELYVDGRGSKEEIDIFPGKPCNNKLAGNVVDLCPVGALLDKDFLFKQRVWLLKRVPSVSPVDSGGENIYLEYNEGIIYRVKPRYNADVNTWWISDDTRYSYRPVHDTHRLRKAMKTQFGTQVETSYHNAIEIADNELRRLAKDGGAGSLFVIFSPMMANEEAYLLGTYIRSIDPKALLVMGPVPTTGELEVFKHYLTGKTTFTIQPEKVPNRKGIERVMQQLGGPMITLTEFSGGVHAALKPLKAGWIVGGYLSNWVTDALKLPKSFKVVQDILPNKLTETADVLLPAAAWAEKDGSWENHAGTIQPFVAAIAAPGGAMREGDVYYRLIGRKGFYNAVAVRAEMGEPFASIQLPSEDAAEPAFEFVEL